MKKKETRRLLATMISSLVMIAFVGAMVIHKASASNTATISISPELNPGPYLAGDYIPIAVRLSTVLGFGAPHESTEPNAAPTDKTWSWEVIISFDPTVVQIDYTIDVWRGDLMDDPAPLKTSWFDQFHKYTWSTVFKRWSDAGPYGAIFSKAWDNTTGTVSAFHGLTEDPTKIAIPTGTTPQPNSFLQSGTYYDLPWSDGISTLSFVSPLTAYAGDYFTLYSFMFKVMKDIPAGSTVYSPIHIVEARLWEYDGATLYPATLKDGAVGAKPGPEFPLGLTPIMMLAPLIPIVYLWRTRKKVTKK